MRWAISGGAGLPRPAPRTAARRRRPRGADARRRADRRSGRAARRGDPRRHALTRPAARLVEGADVLVHAAAALPIRGSRERSSPSTSTAPRRCSRPRRGRRPPRRVHLVDGGLRRAEGAPDLRGRAARRRRLVRRVEDRGRGGDARLRPPRARVRDRPPEDVHRPGAARRLRDPLRLDPRRPAHLRARRRARTATSSRRRGSRRRDRARGRAAGGGGRGVQRRRHGVRHGSRGPRGADRPRGVDVAADARPGAARRRSRCARSSSRVSPLAEWHYKTAHRDSFVDVSKAERLLGWAPQFSNAEALCRTTTGTWRTARR